MKTLLVLFAILTSIPPTFAAGPKHVLMLVNEGYRPEEYFAPRASFDHAGIDVQVAARYLGTVLPSRPHIHEVPPVKVDLTFDQVEVAKYDAIVFVGGNGAWNDFLPNPTVHRILLDSFRQEKITALICAATGLLATADNMDGAHPRFRGRHVTGYFEVEGLLKNVGLLSYDAGTAGKPYVVTDGKLVTGRDPLSAQLFGDTLVSLLK